MVDQEIRVLGDENIIANPKNSQKQYPLTFKAVPNVIVYGRKKADLNFTVPITEGTNFNFNLERTAIIFSDSFNLEEYSYIMVKNPFEEISDFFYVSSLEELDPTGKEFNEFNDEVVKWLRRLVNIISNRCMIFETTLFKDLNNFPNIKSGQTFIRTEDGWTGITIRDINSELDLIFNKYVEEINKKIQEHQVKMNELLEQWKQDIQKYAENVKQYEIVRVVTQTGHGFVFEPVMYSISQRKFVKAVFPHGADGVAVRVDDNNFRLVWAGRVEIPSTAKDTQQRDFVLGEYYFLGEGSNGGIQREKPDTYYQHLFQVMYSDELRQNIADVLLSVPINQKGKRWDVGEAKTTVNDIEELKMSDFPVGKVVEILGYYKAGDGADHKRIISATDDGSGVQLSNNLWACIVHNGEVNVSWFGAKATTEKEIFDNSNIIKKITLIETINKIIFPSGLWGMNVNIARNNIDIVGSSNNSQFYQLKNNGAITTIEVNNIKGTVFFPVKDEQQYVLGYGVTEKECRNYSINNISFITNCLEIQDGKLKTKVTGAVGALNIISAFKGRINNIVFTGTNKNCRYGFKFNGYETYMDNIMFRQIGGVGVDFDYLFDLYSKTNEGVYSVPSGLRITNVGFEAGAIKFMHCQGIDYSIDGISVEFWLGYLQDGVRSIEPTALKTGYKHLGIIDIDENTLGINVSNITVQGLGCSFEQNGVQYSVDSFVNVITKYGDSAILQGNNFVSQDTKKDIYVHSYFYGRSNIDSLGNYTSKIIKNFCNISCDTGKQILFETVDNIELNITNIASYYHGKKLDFEKKVFSNFNEWLNYKNNVFNTTNFYSKKYEDYLIGYFIEDISIPYPKVFSKFIFCGGINIKNGIKVSVEFTGSSIARCLLEIDFLFDDGSTTTKEIGYLIVEPKGVSTSSFFVEGMKGKVLKEVILRNKNYHSVFIKKVKFTDESSIQQLNTLYYMEKMKQENVYGDYISYMDEKTVYDKKQRKLEEDKQLAYEEALKENPELTFEEFMSVQPMTLNLVEEPQPSETLKKFMDKYL